MTTSPEARSELRFVEGTEYFLLFTGRRDCETDGLAEEDRDESNQFGEDGKINYFKL